MLASRLRYSAAVLAGIPGAVWLWASVFIFAASNSVVHVLTDVGEGHLINGRNPITFCNLLAAGNACASLALIAAFYKQWTRENIAKVSREDWLAMLVLAGLTTALAPAWYFVALERTMVTNVVLIAQIEPPLTLALSFLVLGERIRPVAALGAGVALLGVVLTIVLQPREGGFMLGVGELAAAGAAASYAVSTVIARPRLARIPTGIFSVFRNVVGTIVFSIIALYLYGAEHFADIGSAFLWKWMLVYGGLVIVGGQLAWFQGLRSAKAIDVSLATSAAPVAGVLAAYLILGEEPMRAQYIGGAILMVGISIGVIGERGAGTKSTASDSAPLSADATLQAESGTGFKGV